MRSKLVLGAVCATAALAAPSAALAHDGGGSDDANAGTVSAFSDGALTIKMADGSSVTGRVDESTDIACIPSGWLKSGDRSRHRMAHAAHHGHGDRRGRRHSARSESPGDRGWHRGQHRPYDCDASALTAGTTVREADLKATSTGLVFDDVELIKERAAG